MRRLLPLLALLLALVLPGPGPASADPLPGHEGSRDDGDASGDADLDEAEDEGHLHEERRTFDYSRFSDGPRRVPTPRGASLARMEALGLGSRECAQTLLHGRPEARWVSAVRGEAPSRLLWPVDEGRWVRGFGFVRTTRPDLIHRGIDIAADTGTVVRAVADGIVAYSDNEVRGYGNLVLIVHANGWVSLYAHNSRVTVPPGYRVRRGERIALVGATGIARGPHLHFELWQEGRAVNPAALFDGGPTFVERLAERAAARGDVPPPEPLSRADRRTEPPLPPHPDDLARETSERARAEPAPETGGDSGGPLASLGGRRVGTLSIARRLLTRAPSDRMREEVGGRIFSDLLEPVRGAEVSRRFAGRDTPLRLRAAAAAPVRAPEDALVAFAGELPGRGRALVLVSRSGRVIALTRLAELAVEAGARVERGEWVGRTGASELEVELRVGGLARDPAALFRR